MTKEEWLDLKAGQLIYFGPNKIPRIIKGVTPNKTIIMDAVNRTKLGCPETMYPKYERNKFFLTK
jgi:hypothetical protein